MSEEKQEVATPNILEQFKQQHAQFVTQREIALNNYNQLLGAIAASELMIKKLENEESKVFPQENLGGQGNGEVDNQKQEQTAEK